MESHSPSTDSWDQTCQHVKPSTHAFVGACGARASLECAFSNRRFTCAWCSDNFSLEWRDVTLAVFTVWSTGSS